MSDAPLTFLGISGSLRTGSYNTATLRALPELAPEGVSIESAEIGDIPLYNEDARQSGYPSAVVRLREQVRKADAVIFVTPEYNYSIPGVLKNAIDWVSRPPDQPFAGKPASIMGASPGGVGTARAQYHLRQVGVYLDLTILNLPEVMIAQAPQRFDEQGRLVHEPTREFIRKHLLALQHWTRVIQADPAR
ncbi:MAG: NADPH-dependent FMN reductase [Burkholderiaceae bacterium]